MHCAAYSVEPRLVTYCHSPQANETGVDSDAKLNLSAIQTS
jgi:hypothetical protein